MKKRITWNIDRASENILWQDVRLEKEEKKVYFKIHFPQEFTYGSYLVVVDAYKHLRLQKLLGYGEQNLCIADLPEMTSVGGIAGEIPEGTWRIGLGIFTEYLARYDGKIPVKVELEITTETGVVTQSVGEHVWISDDGKLTLDAYDWNLCRQKGTRWYKGDFHTHTRLSDGKETVEGAMKLAKQMELDFYVPTEHNLVHTGWVETSVLPIPGIEITTDFGHCNFFGITSYPSKIMDIMQHMGQKSLEQDLLHQIAEAKQKGWLLSINHPFLHIWKWLCREIKLEDLDCLEIVNDPTYTYARESNDKAICFLDLLWSDGYKICGVGGSDAHNLPEECYPGADLPSIVGDPGTYVYADACSPQKILQAVRERHVCVSRFCRVEISADDGNTQLLPGDEMKAAETEAVIRLYGDIEHPVITVVRYDEIEGIQKEPVTVTQKDGRCEGHYKYYVKGEYWQWFRFEVRDPSGQFLAYSNPLYYGKKEHRLTRYGDALDKLEQKDAD